MSESRIRELERRASLGDAEALGALEGERLRRGHADAGSCCVSMLSSYTELPRFTSVNPWRRVDGPPALLLALKRSDLEGPAEECRARGQSARIVSRSLRVANQIVEVFALVVRSKA